MRLKKMDTLTLKRPCELTLPGTGRSVFEAGTELVVSRVNNRYIYARTDGGTGLGLIIEVRILRRDVQHSHYAHEPRKQDGISAKHKRYFGSDDEPVEQTEPPSEPTVIRRPRRAS